MNADVNDGRPPDYEVGYKKPPQATKFRKGASGNPAGGRRRKPKPAKTSLEVFGELLSETTTVTIGGCRKRITYEERYWRRVFADADKGDRCARKLIADHLKEREKAHAKARASAPVGDLIAAEGEPHKFSWTEEQDKLFAKVERAREAYAEACADEERELREYEELRANVERLKEEHEKVCADLERAKEEFSKNPIVVAHHANSLGRDVQ